MPEAEYICELLWPLLAHRGKKAMPPEVILSRATIPPEDKGQAKYELDDLADLPFIADTGRGYAVDTSKQGQIADYLYYECGIAKEKIRIRLKHYEGWHTHEWTPSDW